MEESEKERERGEGKARGARAQREQEEGERQRETDVLPTCVRAEYRVPDRADVRGCTLRQGETGSPRARGRVKDGRGER